MYDAIDDPYTYESSTVLILLEYSNKEIFRTSVSAKYSQS